MATYRLVLQDQDGLETVVDAYESERDLPPRTDFDYGGRRWRVLHATGDTLTCWEVRDDDGGERDLSAYTVDI